MKVRVSGLQLQLIALIVLPFFLLLLLISVLSIRIHSQAMRRLVAERDERSVRAAAAAITERLHHKASALHQLLLRLENGTDAQRVLEEAAFLDPDFSGGLAVWRNDGTLVAATPDWSFPPPSAARWAEGWKGAGEETLHLGPQRLQGHDYVILVRGMGHWVVMGAFPGQDLLRSLFLMPYQSEQTLVALLVNQEGELLAGLGELPPRQQLPGHPGVQSALRGETGSSYLPGEDGEHVVAFSTIQPMGWALVLEEPWAEVGSPLLNLSLLAPLALVPALLLAAGALWFGARQVVQPLRRLEGRARQWAFSPPGGAQAPMGGIAEIRHLEGTLQAMSRRLHAAQQALRGYIGAITQAQEEERRRIARELHDETIQHLISLDQRIQMLHMQLQARGTIDPGSLDTLHQEMQRAVQELRRLSRGLRPLYLEDLGLSTALEMLCRDVQAESAVQIRYRTAGELPRLDATRELALYRIVQEALSNIARHAQARHGEVVVESDERKLRVTISDDGVGFSVPEDLSELAARGHYGLLGMLERAAQIGARLEIESSPGAGTRIVLSMPLPQPLDAGQPPSQR
jgi:signal transduction histidine kinase